MADRNPFIPNERRMDVESKAHDQQDYMEDENTRTFNEQQAKQKQDSIQERMARNEHDAKQNDVRQSPDSAEDAPDDAAPG